MRWGLLPLLVVTVVASVAAWGLGLLLGRLLRRWTDRTSRRVSPGTPPARSTATRRRGRHRDSGVALALVTILPAIGRPDELVDSPDAVYHLNRIALFLDTGNFSIANPTFYPNGFHAWIATSLIPGVADVLPGTNVATLVLAAARVAGRAASPSCATRSAPRASSRMPVGWPPRPSCPSRRSCSGGACCGPTSWRRR